MEKVDEKQYRPHGPAVLPVVVTATQRRLLERLVRRAHSEQSLVRRAKLVLAMADGAGNEPAARQVGGDREMAQAWRERWRAREAGLAQVEEAEGERGLSARIRELLADRPRSGRPPTYSGEQVARILAIGCEKPTESGRPISHWTPREVAEEAVRRGIVERISVRQVGRFLKRRRR